MESGLDAAGGQWIELVCTCQEAGRPIPAQS